METYKFDDLLKQEMKNPKFKAAFEKEYDRLSTLKDSDNYTNVTKYDFRVSESNDKKKRL
ncbi:hypothetical protein [Companilactobacillus hulinensis]|uniref:hypothetical protein n=1 Tax=Companilactobacillus hulinensis TaxID=2486007 RepID=UPI000F7B6795|nr:hypothetical protein [Companilactobacillus hulinensis]